MAEQNIWASIGQARAEDFQAAKRREKKERRKLMRDQLLYGALLQPVGQAIGQGVTEFINQPFVSKADEWENEREVKYREFINEQDKLKDKLDVLERKQDPVLEMYNQSGHAKELDLHMQELTGQRDWRQAEIEDKDGNIISTADYASRQEIVYKEALSAQLKELRESVALGKGAMSADKYAALLKKNNPYARTAIGAGIRTMGRFLWPLGDKKPMSEKEIAILKDINPTMYAYINDPETKKRMTEAYDTSAEISEFEKDGALADAAALYREEEQERRKAKEIIQDQTVANHQAFDRLTTTPEDTEDWKYTETGEKINSEFIFWARKNGLTLDNAIEIERGQGKVFEDLESRYNNFKALKDWKDGGQKIENPYLFDTPMDMSDLEDELDSAGESIKIDESVQKKRRLEYVNKIMQTTPKSAITEENIRGYLDDARTYIETGDIPAGIFSNTVDAHTKAAIGGVDLKNLEKLYLNNTYVDAAVLAMTDREDVKRTFEAQWGEKWDKDAESREAFRDALNDKQDANRSKIGAGVRNALTEIVKNNKLTEDQISKLAPHLARDMADWLAIKGNDALEFDVESEDIGGSARRYLREVKGGYGTVTPPPDGGSGKGDDLIARAGPETITGLIVGDNPDFSRAIQMIEGTKNKDITQSWIPDVGTITATEDIQGEKWQVAQGGGYKLQITLAPSTVSLLGDPNTDAIQQQTRNGLLRRGSFDNEDNFKTDLSQFSEEDRKKIGGTLSFVSARLRRLEETFGNKYLNGKKTTFLDIQREVGGSAARKQNPWYKEEYETMVSILDSIDIPGYEDQGRRTYEFIMKFEGTTW